MESGVCPASSWDVNSRGTCIKQAICDSYTGQGCSVCAGVDNCGYCESTGKCEVLTATSTGPVAQNCPVNATSAFVTVADQCNNNVDACLSYSCAECAYSTTCTWCTTGDGFCGNPSMTTCSQWSGDSPVCPSSGGGGDGGLTVGNGGWIASAVLLLAPCVVLPLMTFIFRQYRSTLLPVFGSVLSVPGETAALHRLQLIASGVGALGLVLKVISLVLDRWDETTIAGGGFAMHVWYGVIFERSADMSISYFSGCPALFGTCIVQEVAGLWTLGAGITTALLSLIILVGGVTLMRQPHLPPSRTMQLWGSGVVAAMTTATTLTFWGAFHEPQRSEANLAASWYLMLAALFVDFAAVAVARLVVRNTQCSSPLDDAHVQLHVPLDTAHNEGMYQPLMASTS